MNKIKICHVVSGLVGGGVEEMLYNYCSNIDMSKFDMHILYQHSASEKNYEQFKKLNFTLKEIPYKVKHPIKNFTSTYKYLKENKFDIVHCHMTLMNFIPLICAKALKIKVRICHSHNYDARKKNFIVKFGEWVLKKICISCSTDLFACGEKAGEYLYGKKKYIIMRNAIDLEKYSFDKTKREEVRRRLNINDNVIVFGNIGRLTEQKNQKFLLEILNKLKNENKYKLVIIGDGKLKNELYRQSIEYGVHNDIIFTGIISNVQDYYSSFDVFLLPSLWEGLPVTSIEAQANGLKCLFSNNLDNSLIIDSKKTKILKLDVEDWLDEIKRTKANYQRKINFKKFNEKGYNIKLEAKKIEEFYIRKVL